MGNTSSHNTRDQGHRGKTFRFKLAKVLKRKVKTIRLRSRDKFIVERCEGRPQLKPIDDSFHSELEIRRLAFVSLLGLMTTWRNVPPHLLYAAFCILPLKRKWIYRPFKFADELNERFAANVSLDSDETKDFISLLKWKDGQNLVFWMLDELETESEESGSLIAPFWHNLNRRLVSLCDPVTCDNYKPLQLDIEWWKNKETFMSKYGTGTGSIMSEFYFVTMKFNNIQEILYQSNPHSLIPVKSYTNLDSLQMETLFTPCATPSSCSVSDGGEWFISGDYDPYDV